MQENIAGPLERVVVDSKYLNSNQSDVIKPTPKRWIILFLYIVNAANKDFQWIQPSAATNKFAYFYDVDNYVINATSILFMFWYLVLCLPACLTIKRFGLRDAMLLGAGGEALGATIKCFACRTDATGVALLFVGQTCVSLGEQFLFSISSRLVGIWFPDHQVSTALGLSLFGHLFGFALGFEITEYAVQGAESRDEIGSAIYNMFWWTAAASLAAFFANLWMFDDEPKHAPGIARLHQIQQERIEIQNRCALKEEFYELLGKIADMLSDKNFVILSIAFSLFMGVSWTMYSILNQMLAPLWPDNEQLIGNTGFLLITMGAGASILWGWLLDRYRCYMLLYRTSAITTIISFSIFTYCVSYMHSEWAIYASVALFGFVQTGLSVAGLELAVECMYPASELITITVSNMGPMIGAAITTLVVSHLYDNYGALAGNGFSLACICLGALTLFCAKETLARQQACMNQK